MIHERTIELLSQRWESSYECDGFNYVYRKKEPKMETTDKSDKFVTAIKRYKKRHAEYCKSYKESCKAWLKADNVKRQANKAQHKHEVQSRYVTSARRECENIYHSMWNIPKFEMIEDEYLREKCVKEFCEASGIMPFEDLITVIEQKQVKESTGDYRPIVLDYMHRIQPDKVDAAKMTLKVIKNRGETECAE